MKKSVYLFVCLLLSVRFWGFTFIYQVFNNDILLVMMWIWGLFGFIYYHPKKRNSLFSIKYIQYMYWIFLGVLISMFSALFFRGQNFLTTFFSQRGIYSFIFLPVLLFIRPKESEVFKSIKWISIGTIISWVIIALLPDLRYINFDDVTKGRNVFGFYIDGIQYVILYFYFKVQELASSGKKKSLLEIGILLTFVFLYQNRSYLLGILLVLLYILIKFKSNYKFLIYFAISLLLLITFYFTYDIWAELLSRSEVQLKNPNYNRNIALTYYLFHYSPNWFCYMFGNGFPSGGNSTFGNLMWYNFTRGIFASDLGMLGMWTTYGVIPLIAIYSIIFAILFKKGYPLYLKFIALHVAVVPTIFHFWDNPGVMFFVLIIYLYAFNSEKEKYLIKYARYHYSKLQKRV